MVLLKLLKFGPDAAAVAVASLSIANFTWRKAGCAPKLEAVAMPLATAW
jgi:hypothetical protein